MDLKHLVFYHNTVFIFIFPVISVSILVYGKIEFSLKPLLEWGGSGGEGGGGGGGRGCAALQSTLLSYEVSVKLGLRFSFFYVFCVSMDNLLNII